MNRRQRILVATAVVAAVISLGFGFLPFAVTLRVQLPFLDVGATVSCAPPFLEMFGDDEPCTERARERAGWASALALVLLLAGAPGPSCSESPHDRGRESKAPERRPSAATTGSGRGPWRSYRSCVTS